MNRHRHQINTTNSDQDVPTSPQFLLSAMVVLAMLNTTWASIGGLDEFLDAVGWERLYGEDGDGDGEASTLGPSSHGTSGGSGGGGSAASVVGAAPRATAGGVTRRDIKRHVYVHQLVSSFSISYHSIDMQHGRYGNCMLRLIDEESSFCLVGALGVVLILVRLFVHL